jgi:hypothetical protein
MTDDVGQSWERAPLKLSFRAGRWWGDRNARSFCAVVVPGGPRLSGEVGDPSACRGAECGQQTVLNSGRWSHTEILRHAGHLLLLKRMSPEALRGQRIDTLTLKPAVFWRKRREGTRRVLPGARLT